MSLNLMVAGSNLRRSRIYSLFIVFLNALYKAAFCRVLVSICETKLHLCVKVLIKLIVFDNLSSKRSNQIELIFNTI